MNASFRFRPGISLGEEVTRVVVEQIAEASQWAKGAGPISERVRKARVCCKKIRATLRLVTGLDQKAWAQDDVFFRDSARLLSGVRDAAAVVATLDDLRQQWGDKVPANTFTKVRRALDAAQRGDSRNSKEQQKIFLRFAGRMRQAERRLGRRRISGNEFEGLAEGLETVYRRARQAFRHVEHQGTTEAFHRWRKRAKAHAYHGRLLRAAWPEMMKRWERMHTLLSQLLGDEHDLAVLRQRLRPSLVGEPGRLASVAELLALIEERRSDLRTEALVLGRRIYAEKPKAYLRRLTAWWSVAVSDQRSAVSLQQSTSE